MKTIYKTREILDENVQTGVTKLNSTGSLWRKEGTNYDLIYSYRTPIAYVQDVEHGTFLRETKVILCNHFYSMTTRKHQAKVRELYSFNFIVSENNYEIGEFELGAFFKRAKLDNVDVSGGVHGYIETNKGDK